MQGQTGDLSQPASKRASKQASEQASKQASEQAAAMDSRAGGSLARLLVSSILTLDRKIDFDRFPDIHPNPRR